MKKVEMNDCKFKYFDDSNNPEKPLLVTKGISTCIAIVAQGTLEGIDYCGLYHWSGFNGNSDVKTELDDLFSALVLNLLDEFGCRNDSPPPLSSLYIIGGEQAQWAKDGTLNVSGTEAEVTALKENVMSLCERHFSINAEFNTFFDNYLTSNLESLTVKVYPNKISYMKEETFLNRHGKRPKAETIMFDDSNMVASKKLRH